jgi:hypothetical protein
VLSELKLNGSAIEYSTKLTNLGLLMDNRFAWLRQANDARKKVNFVLSRLWHFADVTPMETRMKLVKSLALPKFCIVMLYIRKLFVKLPMY